MAKAEEHFYPFLTQHNLKSHFINARNISLFVAFRRPNSTHTCAVIMKAIVVLSIRLKWHETRYATQNKVLLNTNEKSTVNITSWV